jgi:hypothetical protein
MHYVITRTTRGWFIEREPELVGRGIRIGGPFSTRREAVQIARLLAGWRGSVTIRAGRAA